MKQLHCKAWVGNESSVCLYHVSGGRWRWCQPDSCLTSTSRFLIVFLLLFGWLSSCDPHQGFHVACLFCSVQFRPVSCVMVHPSISILLHYPLCTCCTVSFQKLEEAEGGDLQQGCLVFIPCRCTPLSCEVNDSEKKKKKKNKSKIMIRVCFSASLHLSLAMTQTQCLRKHNL